MKTVETLETLDITKLLEKGLVKEVYSEKYHKNVYILTNTDTISTLYCSVFFHRNNSYNSGSHLYKTDFVGWLNGEELYTECKEIIKENENRLSDYIKQKPINELSINDIDFIKVNMNQYLEFIRIK